MSEMVERVARAVAEFNEFSWEHCAQSHWIDLARAAIEAMREPTEEMIRVGVKYDHECAEADGIYRAMIDAALNGAKAQL